MQAMIDQMGKDHQKALDALKESNGGEIPPFVQHALGLIKRAEIRDPLYQPIVSVQPMTQPVGGIAFYRPKYGSEITRVEAPVGKEVLFKVGTLAALLWLLDQAAEDPQTGWQAKKWLIGYGPDGRRCAEFHSETFRVIDGLGEVVDGGYEVSGLKTNEAYADFLITLNWQSAFGWPTEMHVLGVASTDGVDVAEEKTV